MGRFFNTFPRRLDLQRNAISKAIKMRRVEQGPCEEQIKKVSRC
jgi:hypothetical protein